MYYYWANLINLKTSAAKEFEQVKRAHSDIIDAEERRWKVHEWGAPEVTSSVEKSNSLLYDEANSRL